MRYTSVPPMALLPWLINALTATGATVTSQSPTAVTGEYRYKQESSPWIAMLLFLLFVVPFILYVISTSRETRHTFSITVQPWGTGSAVTYMADTMILHHIHNLVAQLPE